MKNAAVRQRRIPRWGEAPVALAPTALRAVAGDRPVPGHLCERAGEQLSLRSLDARFWARGVKLEKRDISRLVRWLGRLLTEHRDAAIAEPGFPPIPLPALCLSAQTQKIFEAALGRGPLDCEQLTIGAILDLPDVGPKRALEFLAALDAVIDDAYRKPLPGVPSAGERRRSQRTPREIKTFFRVLAAWAGGERRETTIGSSLPEPHPDWPPELVQLWKRVRECSVADLAGSLAQRYGIPHLIARAFKGSDARQRLILRARVFSTDSPTSIDSLARALDCTHENVKVMQQEALAMLSRLQSETYKPVKLRAQALRRQLGTAIPKADAQLRRVLDWAVADFSDREAREFARSLLFWLAGPYRLRDDWLVASADLANRTTRALVALCDDNGVIAREAAQQALARLGVASQFREAWLRRLGQFDEVPAGLAWTDSAGPRTLQRAG